MTITDVIEFYRQKVRDIDLTAYVQTDEEIATALESSRRQFAARRVVGLDAFTITPSVPPSQSSDPEDEIGYLIACHAAWQYLAREYQYKLTTGQFGVIWRSGLEEENSLQASNKYLELLNTLTSEWQDWLLIINRDRFSSRIQ